MTRRLFYADHHTLPLPPGHRFPIGKYRRLRELLERDGVFALEPAPLAEIKTIVLAHDPEYVESLVRRPRDSNLGFGRVDLRRNPRSAGDGLGRNPGRRHAPRLRRRGAGFCVFNDIAVAARWAQAEAFGRKAQVAVIDRDVHQGDGTAHIFRDEPSVFTFSPHLQEQLSPAQATEQDGGRIGGWSRRPRVPEETG